MSTQQLEDLDFYVPVKNGEKFIGQCIEGILSQTYQPKRVIIYYTQSDDKTLAIIKKYPVEIRYLDASLSDTRNVALQELNADWIGSCDADVVLAPDWIETIWNKRHTGATILSGNTQEKINTAGDLFRSIISPHNWGQYDVYNPYMMVPDQIARRKRLIDIGSYQAGLFNYEDSEIAKRLKEAGDIIYYVAGAKATHLRSDNSLSILNLRWNYSFQRQVHLFENEVTWLKKIYNAIGMATLAWGKSKEHINWPLLQICLALPLHHFKRDAEYFCKKNDFIIKDTVDISQQNKLKEITEKLFPELAQEIWPTLQPFIKTQSFSAFCNIYIQFLKAALTYLGKNFSAFIPSTILQQLASIPTEKVPEYLFSKLEWEQNLQRLLQQSKKYFKSIELPLLDASHCQEATLAASHQGILSYQQKLLPSQDPIFTCRDLTERIAKHQKKILWTETFQGSSLISFY